MSLRETLDDAADLALDGRRVDPVAVLAKAARDDAPAARLRRRAPWLLGVAAAAVVLALTAALLPWPAFGRVAPATPPPLGPTGLPTRLDAPPPWTPLVTEQPIEAASVLFPGEAAHGVAGTGRGLFVLSADGRHYRRLPRTGDQVDAARALSADGRWVAWTDANSDGSGTGSTVHVLRLRDGQRRDVRLDGIARNRSFSVSALAFLPRSAGLVVSGQVMDPQGNVAGRTWRAGLSGSPVVARVVCECLEVFGLAADGTVYRADLDRPAAGLADLPQLPSAGQGGLGSGPWPVAVAPDGSGWAQGNGDRILQVVVGGRLKSLDQPDRSEPLVLGWGPRGVLVRWMVAARDQLPSRGRLVWVDPANGTGTPIAELPAWTAELQPLVAAGLVATGRQVPTAPPEQGAWWSGDHLRYLAGRGFALAIGIAGVLLIAGFPWILRRLRRRDGAVLTDANGVAGNQGRLW